MQDKLIISRRNRSEAFPWDETLASPLIVQVRTGASKLETACTRQSNIVTKNKQLAERDSCVKIVKRQAVTLECLAADHVDRTSRLSTYRHSEVK